MSDILSLPIEIVHIIVRFSPDFGSYINITSTCREFYKIRKTIKIKDLVYGGRFSWFSEKEEEGQRKMIEGAKQLMCSRVMKWIPRRAAYMYRILKEKPVFVVRGTRMHAYAKLSGYKTINAIETVMHFMSEGDTPENPEISGFASLGAVMTRMVDADSELSFGAYVRPYTLLPIGEGYGSDVKGDPFLKLEKSIQCGKVFGFEELISTVSFEEYSQAYNSEDDYVSCHDSYGSKIVYIFRKVNLLLVLPEGFDEDVAKKAIDEYKKDVAKKSIDEYKKDVAQLELY